MQRRLIKILQKHSIETSLLIHLLFFLSVSLLLLYSPIPENKASQAIPSYLYRENEKPPQYDEEGGHKKVNEAEEAKSPQESSSLMESKETETKPTTQSPSASAEVPTEKMIKNQVNEMEQKKQFMVMDISRDAQPVHLVGDKNVHKPRLILLGKALANHLSYPKAAIDFDIRGIVLVGFLLSPDGEINYTQVVRSSGAGILDEEALVAVKAMSPVKKVESYLKESQFLIVGVIFG
jgi:TonB family protein